MAKRRHFTLDHLLEQAAIARASYEEWPPWLKPRAPQPARERSAAEVEWNAVWGGQGG